MLHKVDSTVRIIFVRVRNGRFMEHKICCRKDCGFDPALGTVFALLREHGFREEARVPDFYREGVALTFLRLEL